MKQPRYNAETEAAMQEARAIMNGEVQSRGYGSARELFCALDMEEDDI